MGRASFIRVSHTSPLAWQLSDENCVGGVTSVSQPEATSSQGGQLSVS